MKPAVQPQTWASNLLQTSNHVGVQTKVSNAAVNSSCSLVWDVNPVLKDRVQLCVLQIQDRLSSYKRHLNRGRAAALRPAEPTGMWITIDRFGGTLLDLSTFPSFNRRWASLRSFCKALHWTGNFKIKAERKETSLGFVYTSTCEINILLTWGWSNFPYVKYIFLLKEVVCKRSGCRGGGRYAGPELFHCCPVPLQHLAAFGRANTLLLGLAQSLASSRNTAQKEWHNRFGTI